jgi:uncharacterized coiled-coil protein SlyX
MPDDIRGWLTEAVARRARHPELEKTLFHQLKELERGPLEQLGDLVRAVVEELRIAQHRLAEQAVDVRTLQQTVAVLTDRLDDLATRVPEPPPVEAGYVLLLPAPDGYRLLQREGPPPAPGELVEGFRVLNRGSSPLPGDRRPCLLALPDAAGPA